MEDHDQYCRLCMSEDDLTEMDGPIRDCVQNMFSIVIRNDELSKEICETCKEFVSKMIQFEEKVNKVQKLLQKILKRKVKNSDIDVNNEVMDNIRTDKDKHLAVTALPVKISKKTEKTDANADSTDTNVVFKNSNELISKLIKSIDLDEVEKAATKMKLHWNPDINFCTVCNRKILDLEQFEKHAKTSVHIFRSYVIEKTGDPYVFSNYLIGYTCSVCKKNFTSKTILATHYRDDHSLPTNKNALKPDTLILKNDKKNEGEKGHLPEIIVKDEPDSTNANINPIIKLKEHPCRLCKKNFGFTESLQKHIQKHHKNVHFCIHCDFISISKVNFSAHLRKHYNITYKQRVCLTCFKVCDSYVDLMKHRKTKHESKILQVCNICTATFSSTTLLKKHNKDVHRTRAEVPKKVFICRRCNRRFMSLMVLKNHQCTAKKFPCLKKCGKRFESFSLMERHSLKCNSGVTVYSCKKCNRSLKSLNTFKAHLSTCLLKISPAPSSKPNEPQISRVNKPEKKIEKPSCSVIQRPLTEIDAVSKKPRVGSAENITNGNWKTVPEEIAQGTYKCIKCFKSLSIMELDKHHETCTPTLTKTTRTKKKKKKRTKENITCEKCDKMFSKIWYLAQHFIDVHGTLPDTIDKELLPKHLVELLKRRKSEHIQQNENPSHTEPSKVPKRDSSPQLPTPSPLVDLNRVSSTSSENSNSHRDYPYKRQTPSHPTSYNTPKMPDRNRYPENTNNQSLSAHNPFKTPVTKSVENSMYTPKLPRSRNDQLTIIQNNQSTCQICKNPSVHLFCNPCSRCFLKNQVQYLNHVKMKHS